MWADNETAQDLLGFKVHADLICSLILRPHLLPMTIGIFGDWGGGKTSIMKMIELTLDPEQYQEATERDIYERVACLYFNGWLFEGYDDAKAAILSSVLIQLGEHKRFGPAIRDKVTSLLKSVNYMRIARLGFENVALPTVAAYITGGASLIPSLAKSAATLFGFANQSNACTENETSLKSGTRETSVDWEGLIKADKSNSGPLDVKSFRTRFADMLKDCSINTLVVLIDDLDRCSPKRIIDNLEAIKLFLNVDRTAFIIGADPRIVRRAIAITYSTRDARDQESHEEGSRDEPLDRLVTDYLEKLIQIPYYLPRLSPAEIETYMVLLFCLLYLSDDAIKCISACERQRVINRYCTFGYASVRDALGTSEMPKPLSNSLALCASIAPLITECLKGNPRQVKRFLNAFVLRKELAAAANLQNIRDDVLVKLMVLEYGHREQFLQLFQWQAEQDGFPEQIRKFEEDIDSAASDSDGEDKRKDPYPKWKTPFILKWIAMQPRLSSFDLRDYFWISRDRLQSTLSGLSLVPPLVRAIFEDLVSSISPKRQAAAMDAENLNEDETTSLLDLLEQHVKQQPDQKNRYDSLVSLIERGIPQAANTMAKVLTECPPNSMPPSIGIDMMTLINAKPELEIIIGPAIDKLSETDSRVGKAIQKRKRKG